MVPSLSGLSDVPCLCTSLDGVDRAILRGRAGTLAYWLRAGVPESITGPFLTSMEHLVMGCSGPCRGNSGTARCVA